MLLVYYNVFCLPYSGDPSLRGAMGLGESHASLHCCKGHCKKIPNFVPEISKRQSLLVFFL